ncbi:putative F-box protein At5g55150 [Tripterygium wilfordii]|uniref:putative F-box protein At5g55150 n=1 Tax=Tripterygium wilfordii TaxID=458696 RepID=UPI0018F81F4D|nr:putative F-box protein At5g55150 [Tripterygium wilfordii]XP_038683177.1 putative F-box protein At5g55150 [Tripterygium wilfordii]
MASSNSWCSLLKELLELIFNRLEIDVDVLRCSFVCTSWRPVALHVYRKFIPLLLFPNETLKTNSWTLFDLTTRETRDLHLQETCRRWIPCSSNGWLLTIGVDCPHKMHLLNVISKSQVLLPSIDTLKPSLDSFSRFDKSSGGDYYINKVIVSSCPSNPGCSVLVNYYYRSKLALCTVGDEKWRILKTNLGVEGIVCYKGEFYVIDELRRVFICTLISETLEFVCRVPNFGDYRCIYLVESLYGELLLVIRKCCDWNQFEVCKLDLKLRTLFSVKNLRNQALFLGINGSAVVARGCSRFGKGNCIYFIAYDHPFMSPFFMGHCGPAMFDMEMEKFEWFHETEFSNFENFRKFHWISPDICH